MRTIEADDLRCTRSHMEKPILFNTEMVRAILDGRKTVTRRVLKGVPKRDDLEPYIWFGMYGLIAKSNSRVFRSTPPCLPSDVLYVRETWSTTDTCGLFPPWPSSGTHYIYRADAEPNDPIINEVCWSPSIHMPREAARIFLRVTDVRVERLKAITEDGVCEEGAEKLISCPNERTIYYPEGGAEPCFNTNVCSKCNYIDKSYPELFGKLVWNKTIKPRDLPLYSWDANPWVWVIEFERLEDYKPNESNP